MRLASDSRIREVVDSMRPTREGCERVADAVEQEARSIAYAEAFDSGEYAAKIDRMPTHRAGSRVVARSRISAAIEVGTGVYGPKRRPITPKRGKYLVFRIPKGAPRAAMSGSRKPGDLVFATSVKGRPATHTMERAAKSVASRRGLRWRPGRILS